ncbi:VIT and VWA domain-containing protein [Desulfobulbus sp.]|uniref:VIT and vWA domain-containing protein n=1 Tax=Desulfobulbus sp. TaxID=895 RepID=UPI00286EF4A8|nr:VIT and VWA domain-containing protein [Desulfobulbus sp.]
MITAQDASITGTNGTKIALKSVHIEGQVDGLLATMAITQRYRNDSGKKLEIVYTFPLAWGATLLGMEVTLGNRRLQTWVVEKKKAVAQYEKAIDDGDVPVLVEASAPGLYTTNLGNIEDGEDVTVELRYAQLLRLEQGRIRLSVPCVLAPRYGDPRGKGGLAQHETTTPDIAAEYPLTISISLRGQAAKATIQCPSHMFSVRERENGLAVLVNAEAMLDRDFILTFEEMEERSFALLSPDSGRYMMLAGFCPNLPVAPEPLRMKILVDCSGSMTGDSITQARQALRRVLRELKPTDHVSYSRFGNTVVHACGCLVPCEEEALERLAAVMDDTQADMGGTKMEQALLSTFNDISMPDGDLSSPALLLITDGEIWNMEEVIRAAQVSGQRVFAVGVGSAPAESLLRQLAQKTGGACELVTPNEDIGVAIERMVRRMRGAPASSIAIDWRDEPVWQSALPSRLYAGETVHAFALFAAAPARPPVLHWTVDEQSCRLAAASVSRTHDDTVARLGGARRMTAAATPEETRELALTYQLVSQYSSLLLVHKRDGVKSAGLPLLHHVPQMMAAGHQGFGSVRQSRQVYPTSVVRSPESGSRRRVDEDLLEMPAFLRKSGTFHSDKPGRGAGRLPNWKRYPGRSGLTYQETFTGNKKCLDSFFKAFAEFSPTPLELLQELDKNSLQETDGLHVMRLITKGINQHPGLIFKLAEIHVGLKLPAELVLALLLDWLQIRFHDSFTLSRHAQRLLRSLLNTMPDEVKNVAAEALVEEFLHAAE